MFRSRSIKLLEMISFRAAAQFLDLKKQHLLKLELFAHSWVHRNLLIWTLDLKMIMTQKEVHFLCIKLGKSLKEAMLLLIIFSGYQLIKSVLEIKLHNSWMMELVQMM